MLLALHEHEGADVLHMLRWMQLVGFAGRSRARASICVHGRLILTHHHTFYTQNQLLEVRPWPYRQRR